MLDSHLLTVKKTFFLFHRKFFSIQDYETSTEKNQYQFLYEKGDELKGNENEGIVEY